MNGNTTARYYIHVLGTIASCLELIPNARLYMRPLQLHLLQNWSPSQMSLDYSKAKISFEMVAMFSKHFTGSIVTSKTNLCNNHNRCFHDGMGRSYEQFNCSGSLVKSVENTTHKQFRTDGSFSNNQEIYKISEKQRSSGQDRQCHSGTIYQQAGGYTFTSAMSTNMGSLDVCFTKQHDSKISPYSRQKELSSGRIEQNKSAINRMGIEQCHSPKNFSDMGVSISRSVCNSAKQEDNSILLMDTTSTSFSGRCTDNELGGAVRICISSPVTNTKSSESHAKVSVRGDTDSPMLAKTALVSTTSTITSSLSNKTSKHRKSIDSGKKIFYVWKFYWTGY